MFQPKKDAMQDTVDVGINGGDLFVIGKTGYSSSSIASNAFEFQQVIDSVGDVPVIFGYYLAGNALHAHRAHVVRHKCPYRDNLRGGSRRSSGKGERSSPGHGLRLPYPVELP